MDRPTLKLEVPLPRWPSSPVVRFSMRTLITAVAAIGVALAIYTHARNAERAQHDGGYFHLVVSAPDMMSSTTLRCADHPSVFKLAQSREISIRPPSDLDPKVLWPPKVWITRADWDGAELEETITVQCAGTPDEPQIDSAISIKPGDRVFFDFGKRRTGNVTPQVSTDDLAIPERIKQSHEPKGKQEATRPMSHPAAVYATLDDWIAREATQFSADSPESFNAALDKLIASLGDSVELLGFGEALHGGEDILILRNRLFQRLVEAHGYTAIAVESSFPRARVVNEYVAGQCGTSLRAVNHLAERGATLLPGRGPAPYEDVQETGFSHGFGRLDANRELVEWMRGYNADPRHRVRLQFYGFDSPTEMVGSDSPRQVLHFVLDYLASIDRAGDQERRQRIDALLGQDAAWENPAASFDAAKSIGLSPAATALRIATEDLLTELRTRRPELVASSDERRYLEAVHYASVARQLLNYHAALARESGDRIVRLLGMRDVMMADNLAYIVRRERGCDHGGGKVLAFAHNSHLKRGKAQWQLGPDLLIWWPAGAHLHEMFGPRYAIIGSAVGISDDNGIGPPEAGTLEARLTAAGGPARFIPTHQGHGLPTSAIAALPTRSSSVKNLTYFALTPQSFTDFDWLAVLNSTAYNRGGPPLQQRDASPK